MNTAEWYFKHLKIFTYPEVTVESGNSFRTAILTLPSPKCPTSLLLISDIKIREPFFTQSNLDNWSCKNFHSIVKFGMDSILPIGLHGDLI